MSIRTRPFVSILRSELVYNQVVKSLHSVNAMYLDGSGVAGLVLSQALNPKRGEGRRLPRPVQLRLA
jgi:hypothetical protein